MPVGLRSQVTRDLLVILEAQVDFVSVYDLWKGLGCWAKNSVRASLLALYETGIVERQKMPFQDSWRWGYRLRRGP